MAWLFIGVWLLLEGLKELGVTFGASTIIQAICLVIAGILFILSFHWGNFR